MAAKNAILKTKIEGVIYEIMVKTGAANVYVDDTTTLSAKLAEIIADLALKATKTELTDGLALKAEKSHTHAQADVTGLADALTARPTTEAMNTAISTAISDLIGGAPETYDTLKDIADYIESHKSVETALNEAIGKKADKATTLAGYGITDSMTATQINKAIQDALATATGGESAADVKVALDNYKSSNDTRVKAIEDDYLKAADKTALQGNIDAAKEIANAKSKIYYSATEPAGLAEGDLWFHLQA
jgi:hypothetical protein